MVAAPTADAASPPSRFGSVAGVLTKLIELGKQLAAAFRQPAVSLMPENICFGADSITMILARIARGLLRAQVLHERLLHFAPTPPPPEPRSQDAPSAPRQCAVRPATPRTAAATCEHFDQLPTAEQIAAEDRRRPIGAVLADIARDLGITPSHPLWRELTIAVGMNGGNFVNLFRNAIDRIFNNPGWQALMRSWFPQQSPPAAAATGPP